MVTNLSATNSILSGWLRDIRDVHIQQNRTLFRLNLERIGQVAAYEISKCMPYKEVLVETPMGEATCAVPEHQPVLAVILRAGLPLYQGLLQVFDKADSAFVAAYRKHRPDGSFEINQEYVTSPAMTGRTLIVADPMVATGASLVQALESLTEFDQPSAIHIVSAIACTVGIEYILRKFPEAHLWAGAIDDELTAKGYIVPGLGDAGDLAFGEKRQG
jgi:uracil phosphoribosyltransferase